MKHLRLLSFAALAMIIGHAAPATAQKVSKSQPLTSLPAKPVKQAAKSKAKAAAVQVPLPSASTQLALIRGLVEAVNQANRTANYSVLYMLGSAEFQRANTMEKLALAFAPFRSRNVSLSAALVLPPSLSRPVVIEDGVLRLTGFFPSQPDRIVFDLRFVDTQGGWRVFGLNIQLSAQNAAQIQYTGQKPIVAGGR